MDRQNTLSLDEILVGQRALWEAHQDTWSPLTPEHACDSLLWMIEEIGEVVALIKKQGEGAIVNDPALRSAFVEEMSDVLMYWGDVLLRYGISAEEFTQEYRKKQQHNLLRNFEADATAIRDSLQNKQP